MPEDPHYRDLLWAFGFGALLGGALQWWLVLALHQLGVLW